MLLVKARFLSRTLTAKYPALQIDTISECAFCTPLAEIRCGRTGTGTGHEGRQM